MRRALEPEDRRELEADDRRELEEDDLRDDDLRPLDDRDEAAFLAVADRRLLVAFSRSSDSALTSFFDSDLSSSVRNLAHSLCSSRSRLASLAVSLSPDAFASARSEL